ncbi:DUF2957 domain-containing protein [Burkholderia guangdongensis]|uniref:DUF2957 domain-containing protein n=1 Tax=Burkholderia guangdongensis TaxID=1792500 RepID=UPI0015C77227|nr:DUF2957 domain-containing protein [Burkholderia guangdongensis]
MSHALSKGMATAFALAPFLVACGGGDGGGAPSPINAPQCSGSSCGTQGPPVSQPVNGSLCPADADIVKSTYLGGAGSGEIASVNIDAVAMTYTLKWYESPIPLAVGNVTPTRAGTTITGKVVHPTTLPSAEQNRCAFVLTPGSGIASDGSTYSTASTFNPANPPMLLIGMGVAGGGIPGAEVQFNGVLGQFAVPDRKFDFYPFLAFAQVDNNLADLQGTYNALTYHIQPSKQYKAVGENVVETFDASGNCTSPSGSCVTTGGAWSPNANGSYFTSKNAPQTTGPNTLGGLVTLPIVANANMVLGKLNGAIVPVVVRTGVADPSKVEVDDESGIAVLGAANALASGGFDGGYAGADSNFKYTAALIRGGNGTFINPTTAAAEDGFTLQYGASSPGLVSVTAPGGNGFAIATGGLYAVLIQGTVNGGVTPSSAIAGTSSAPYFGVGAKISN